MYNHTDLMLSKENIQLKLENDQLKKDIELLNRLIKEKNEKIHDLLLSQQNSENRITDLIIRLESLKNKNKNNNQNNLLHTCDIDSLLTELKLLDDPDFLFSNREHSDKIKTDYQKITWSYKNEEKCDSCNDSYCDCSNNNKNILMINNDHTLDISSIIIDSIKSGSDESEELLTHLEDLQLQLEDAESAIYKLYDEIEKLYEKCEQDRITIQEITENYEHLNKFAEYIYNEYLQIKKEKEGILNTAILMMALSSTTKKYIPEDFKHWLSNNIIL